MKKEIIYETDELKNQHISYGWMCPVCGIVYSPYMKECRNSHDSFLTSNPIKWIPIESERFIPKIKKHRLTKRENA